jgi:4-hydroxy-3-methylbut-2-en-1-yl diphosphate reductase
MNVVTAIEPNANPQDFDAQANELLLAQPRGFCAGVDRAITIVERALLLFGAPIYVRHEIVHNQYVVKSLREKGVIFIDDLADVPSGATLIFSAHGVSQQVREDAKNLGVQLFDATCPLVTKVHVEVIKMVREGHHVLMIGHLGHPEVEGTIGQVEKHEITLIENLQDIEKLNFQTHQKLAYVTQTTLSVDETQSMIHALKLKFPDIVAPKKQDICYATQNRQDAVKIMAPRCDVIVVVGSENSSNSQRLLEIAKNHGKAAYLVDDPDKLQANWFIHAKRIGLTAGASAPEELAQKIIAKIKSFSPELAAIKIKQLDGIIEDMHFPLPKGLNLDNQS